MIADLLAGILHHGASLQAKVLEMTSVNLMEVDQIGIVCAVYLETAIGMKERYVTQFDVFLVRSEMMLTRFSSAEEKERRS